MQPDSHLHPARIQCHEEFFYLRGEMVWFVYESQEATHTPKPPGNATYQKYTVGPLCLIPKAAYQEAFPLRQVGRPMHWPRVILKDGQYYPRKDIQTLFYPSDHPERIEEGYEMVLLHGGEYDSDRKLSVRGLRLRAFNIGETLATEWPNNNAIFVEKDDAIRWTIECRLRQEHASTAPPSFHPMPFLKSRIGVIPTI